MNTDAPCPKAKHSVKGYLSAAWPAFEAKLAEALSMLQEDHYLIISVKCSERFVQFAGQGSFGLRAETTSNSYLAKSELLDANQMKALEDLGWQPPTGTPNEATPEADPDGSPNFFRDYPSPVDFKSVARLAIKTLAEVLRVPHPGFLQYEAFDDDHPISLPVLGLKCHHPSKSEENAGSVRQKLLTTLREFTGLEQLAYDQDGDIPIQYGSAIVFVRVFEEPLFIRIYSPVLNDVEADPALLSRLNDINANAQFARFVYRNGGIYGLVDVIATPYVAAHVIRAFGEFTAIADGLDDLLQAEFGGRTAFPELMPSLRRH